jgi:hypothetical protein
MSWAHIVSDEQIERMTFIMTTAMKNGETEDGCLGSMANCVIVRSVCQCRMRWRVCYAHSSVLPLSDQGSSRWWPGMPACIGLFLHRLKRKTQVYVAGFSADDIEGAAVWFSPGQELLDRYEAPHSIICSLFTSSHSPEQLAAGWMDFVGALPATCQKWWMEYVRAAYLFCFSWDLC